MIEFFSDLDNLLCCPSTVVVVVVAVGNQAEHKPNGSSIQV